MIVTTGLFFCCGQFWVTGKCRKCGNGGTAPQQEGGKEEKPITSMPSMAKPPKKAVPGVSPTKRLGKWTGNTFCESTFRKKESAP